MSRRFVIPAFAALLTLVACRSGPDAPPAIAEAFVGPASLKVRKELPLQSPVVATVKHGDRVDVIRTRRRFVLVRTGDGAMGWTDSRLLLTTDQMKDLQRFTEAAAALPSQGAASVYEPLNVHTEPSRSAPSFLQIPENGSVQVIGHRVTPRTAAPPRPAAFEATSRRTSRASRKRLEKVKSGKIPPPPRPSPPKLPANWQELSRPTLKDALRAEAQEPAKPGAPGQPKPVVLEDWSLVRTKEGRAGWVLSRMLTMSIPDEVAQYAEGQRITSYFSLGDIQDGGQTRHAWLWTTIARGGQPFEFDGFRVFVWSRKRHRYETVYRGRDVQGYYPVSATKGSGSQGEGATFALVLDDGGNLIRNTYAFNGYRVNLVRSDPYGPEQTNQETAGVIQSAAPANSRPAPAAQPWYKRWSQRIRSRF